MSMEKVITGVVAALFQSVAVSIMIFNQIDKTDKKIKIKFLMVLVLYAIVGFLFIPNQFRFLLFILVISLILFFIVGIKNKNVILYSFNSVAIMTIGEIASTLILVLLGIDSTKIVNDSSFNLLANFLISLFSVLIIRITMVRNLIQKEILLFKKNRWEILC